MAAFPSSFRNRDTQPYTTLAQEAGGWLPHRASARASLLMGWRAFTTSAERTTRSLGLSPFAWPSTRSGPRTAIPMI